MLESALDWLIPTGLIFILFISLFFPEKIREDDDLLGDDDYIDYSALAGLDATLYEALPDALKNKIPDKCRFCKSNGYCASEFMKTMESNCCYGFRFRK